MRRNSINNRQNADTQNKTRKGTKTALEFQSPNYRQKLGRVSAKIHDTGYLAKSSRHYSQKTPKNKIRALAFCVSDRSRVSAFFATLKKLSTGLLRGCKDADTCVQEVYRMPIGWIYSCRHFSLYILTCREICAKSTTRRFVTFHHPPTGVIDY